MSVLGAMLDQVEKRTRVGAVLALDDPPFWAVLDGDGKIVPAASDFLLDFWARGNAEASCRSYAYGLLRWFRHLALEHEAWERAARETVRDFVLSCRQPSALSPRPLSPRTLNHNLAVISAFYDYQLAQHRGPIINPVPARSPQSGRRLNAHHNPEQAFRRDRRADFRRLFATDALRSGLPVHILAKVMGHLNLSTTQGYAAVFDEDVARHFRQFVDRRRALRPTEDYRDPSATELEEFHAHFSKRKVELGSCSRGYGTPCVHEHACIRCPMLRPDPAQRHRLESILANLQERRAEAKRMGWLGELEGIEISIRAAEEKLGQMSQIVRLTLERRRPDGKNPIR